MDENFYNNIIINGNTKFEGVETIKAFFEKSFARNNTFNNFLKNNGNMDFNKENSCFPQLFDLLLKEKRRVQINENDLDEKVIQLPSGTIISKREMFLLKEAISKKFKLLTDVNCTFLDDVFIYLFGNYFDTDNRKKLKLNKRKIYYCPCSGEFLNTNDELLKIGDKCKNCKKSVKGENRIENLSIINQFENLFNREDIKNSIEEYNEKIKQQLETPLNGKFFN